MKAITVEKIGSFRVGNAERPEPGVGEVLVKTAVAGMCRTDLKIIEVGHRDLELPRIPGEEVVGTIVAVGPEVEAGHIGDRVYIYPGISCGNCAACHRGAENLCREMRIMGFHRDGGFADYVLAPLQSTMTIPGDCPFEHAVTAEPLSCCLNALELAAPAPGDSVGIWGGGPAGAFLARAAAAMGAMPTVIEPDERRHRFHAEAMTDPHGRSFDVAVVAVGAPEAYTQALSHLNPRGCLVVFSGLAKNAATNSVDFNDFHYSEKRIVGAYGCSYRHGAQALEWISSGKVQVEDLISHRLPLAQLGKALDLVRKREGMKILLYP